MKLAEVLKSPDKWCKGLLRKVVQIDGKDVTQHCLWGGAVEAARTGTTMLAETEWKALERLAKAFGNVLPDELAKASCHPTTAVVRYNNREDVTFDDIVPIIREYDRLTELETAPA